MSIDLQSFLLGALIPSVTWVVLYGLLPELARRIAGRLRGTPCVIFDFAGLTRVLTPEEARDLIARIEAGLPESDPDGT